MLGNRVKAMGRQIWEHSNWILEILTIREQKRGLKIFTILRECPRQREEAKG